MNQLTHAQGLSSNTPSNSKLKLAISLALFGTSLQAATFNVTETNDDGTGLVANTLSWAILQANTQAGADTIELNTDVLITGVMKRLIDSDINLQSDATRRTIDGNNQYRPLFIKSGQVTIQDLDIQNGLAKGGSSGRGGSGAGLGGGIFIYDGGVNLANISVSNSIASSSQLSNFNFGGGGMFGNARNGGGGLFSNSTSDLGAYGGYGNYQNNDNFAQGGDYSYFGSGSPGGFGAGGGGGYYGDGAAGGFGGGGSYSYYKTQGNGGFGAGGAIGNAYTYLGGEPGFGGDGVTAAGFGGAVFIRTGLVDFENVELINNQAQNTSHGKNSSEGFGGGLFVMHTTQNSNGNNQGMPSTLPTVSGCGVTFNSNTASTDPDLANNNDDVFDLAGLITASNGVAITEPCGVPDQEIQITGNEIEVVDGDVTPDVSDGTNLGLVYSGQSVSQVFDINNLGAFTLQLTTDPIISLTGNNNNQFAISQQPADTAIAGGQTISFELTFNANMLGEDTATVVIENNDPDESPYEFMVQAEGIPSPPEISISGNGVEIIDGDMTPDSSDFTAMGQAQENAQSITRTFIISNESEGLLELTGMPLVELQNNNGQFSISSQPVLSALNNGESVGFAVTFTPTSIGLDSATVVIANNDPDEAPYDFVIEAEGIAQAPILQVLGNGMVIENGDDTPEDADNTFFGYTAVTGGQIYKEFELKNIGFDTLNLAAVEVQQVGNHFSVFSGIQDNQLSPGESTHVTLLFDPEYPSLNVFTAVEVYDTEFNSLHIHLIQGFGQPTLTINSAQNYLQEGQQATFVVHRDVYTPYSFDFDWVVSGGVDADDFGGLLPSGSKVLVPEVDEVTINFMTAEDGVYEGPEFFSVAISTDDPRVHIGFPNVSGGVIDDDLIFVDGFDVADLNRLLDAMAYSSFETLALPDCQSNSCQFLGRSWGWQASAQPDLIGLIAWFEETLVLIQPLGDWDGDGLPNHHDLNPLGLSQKVLKEINQG